MRRRLKMDVLKPSTEWCWADGPREFRLPGGSLDGLTRALAAEGSGALLVHRSCGYVLQWEDGPPRPKDQDAVRAIRRYHLTSRYRNQAIRRTDEGCSLPGPFEQLVALTHENQEADLADRECSNLRDAIWWLLSRAEAALDAIG
jgi:hypothetical protein